MRFLSSVYSAYSVVHLIRLHCCQNQWFSFKVSSTTEHTERENMTRGIAVSGISDAPRPEIRNLFT
jgi:hypothetical protein